MGTVVTVAMHSCERAIEGVAATVVKLVTVAVGRKVAKAKQGL